VRLSERDTAEIRECAFCREERMLNTGSHAGEYIEWLTIKNQVQAVVDDVTHSQPSARRQINPYL